MRLLLLKMVVSKCIIVNYETETLKILNPVFIPSSKITEDILYPIKAIRRNTTWFSPRIEEGIKLRHSMAMKYEKYPTFNALGLFSRFCVRCIHIKINTNEEIKFVNTNSLKKSDELINDTIDNTSVEKMATLRAIK